MERNEISYCAAVMDVEIKLREEVFVLGMGHSTNDAAKKGVPIRSSKEEFVLGMGQSANDAAMMDVQIKSN